MISIAICDDESKDLNHAESLLKRYINENKQYEIKIYSFSAPLELLSYIEENGGFDLILLDIYMSGMLGTDVARELRHFGDDVEIIFLTTSRDRSLDAFEVDAAQYLIKPYSEGIFFSALNKVIGRINIERRNIITLKTTNGVTRISPRDVVFTETGKNNYQFIHTIQGEKLEVRMTSSELFDLFSQNKFFVRCGVSYMIFYIIARTVIYGVIIPLLFKFVRIPFSRLVDALDKEWRAATLVPLIFLILQIFLLYYPVPYWRWESNNWYKYITITVYILFLAVYYLLYIQANAIVEKYLLKGRELLMSQQNKLWESELARQKTLVALASQQRHDMHHHNIVIMSMLQNGDVEGLKTYMKSFDSLPDEYNDNVFCINPIINSLLNVYANRAAAEGIKVIFRVSVPDNIYIESIDLTCVFGNALKNAFEGCLRLSKDDEKEIIVTSKFIDYRLRLQIENTCCDDIIFDGEMPITQKHGGGTGTKSIIYTAELYDGTAGFSVKDGKFITQIVLNAHKNIPKLNIEKVAVS